MCFFSHVGAGARQGPMGRVRGGGEGEALPSFALHARGERSADSSLRIHPENTENTDFLWNKTIILQCRAKECNVYYHLQNMYTAFWVDFSLGLSLSLPSSARLAEERGSQGKRRDGWMGPTKRGKGGDCDPNVGRRKEKKKSGLVLVVGPG